MIMKILKTVLTTSLGLGLGLTGLDTLAIESKELARASVATNQPLYAKNDFDWARGERVSAAQLEYAPSKKTYYPQLSLSGFYGKNKNNYGGIDALLPIFEGQNSLVFLDLRGILKSSPIKEFNAGGGYRWLTDDQDKLFGVYGFFDRKHSSYEQWFNQITVGGEFKTNRYSLGANLYLPITKDKQSVREDVMHAKPYQGDKFILEYGEDVTTEYAMKGADLELGYAIPGVSGLTAYLGGYYFTHKETEKVAGPRAGLALDMIPYFDDVSPLLQHVQLEASVQHDKTRGTMWHAGLRLQMQLGGYGNKQELTKLQRGLTGFVRRDLDVIVVEDAKYEVLGGYKKADGSDYVGQIVTNTAELNKVTTVGSGIDIIGVKGSITVTGANNSANNAAPAIQLLDGQSITGQGLTLEEAGKTYHVAIVDSPNGIKYANPSLTGDAGRGQLILSAKTTGHLLGVYTNATAAVSSANIQRIEDLVLKVGDAVSTSAAITNVKGDLNLTFNDQATGGSFGNVVIDHVETNAPVYFNVAAGKSGSITLLNSTFNLARATDGVGAIKLISDNQNNLKIESIAHNIISPAGPIGVGISVDYLNGSISNNDFGSISGSASMAGDDGVGVAGIEVRKNVTAEGSINDNTFNEIISTGDANANGISIAGSFSGTISGNIFNRIVVNNAEIGSGVQGIAIRKGMMASGLIKNNVFKLIQVASYKPDQYGSTAIGLSVNYGMLGTINQNQFLNVVGLNGLAYGMSSELGQIDLSRISGNTFNVRTSSKYAYILNYSDSTIAAGTVDGFVANNTLSYAPKDPGSTNGVLH